MRGCVAAGGFSSALGRVESVQILAPASMEIDTLLLPAGCSRLLLVGCLISGADCAVCQWERCEAQGRFLARQGGGHHGATRIMRVRKNFLMVGCLLRKKIQIATCRRCRDCHREEEEKEERGGGGGGGRKEVCFEAAYLLVQWYGMGSCSLLPRVCMKKARLGVGLITTTTDQSLRPLE